METQVENDKGLVSVNVIRCVCKLAITEVRLVTSH